MENMTKGAATKHNNNNTRSLTMEAFAGKQLYISITELMLMVEHLKGLPGNFIDGLSLWGELPISDGYPWEMSDMINSSARKAVSEKLTEWENAFGEKKCLMEEIWTNSNKILEYEENAGAVNAEADIGEYPSYDFLRQEVVDFILEGLRAIAPYVH